MSVAKSAGPNGSRANDAGRLSDDEGTSSGSSSGHTSDDEDNDDGHPMMSIFASYYGIEDPGANEPEVKPKGTINDAGFQAEQYVKNLLMNEPFEALVKQDTEMVQEIRTLDGEMQKLVYDNYNKFITATETIKEMKNDVYGMDPDMEAVRLKMEQIAQGSQALDNVLHPTRCKVDKLVRVRRLLDRLGFLNELPERLEVMITHRHYKEAVQLYNKTISVLTRHSHVLSFKKIKERTELMMKDLTGKVIDMLEDPNLEAVKLTQYVGVLRLMKAPAAQVSAKLLAAHKTRSLRMIHAFKQSLLQAQQAQPAAGAASAAGADASGNSAAAEGIASARQFHQSMMVGLIEACKGVIELYCNPTSSAAGAAAEQQHPSSSSSAAAAAIRTGGVDSDRDSADEHEAGDADGEADSDAPSNAAAAADRAAALAAAQAAALAQAQAQAAAQAQAQAGYQALEQVIASVMSEYSKCFLQAFSQFFSKYEAQYLSRAIEYCDIDDIKPEYAAEIRAILHRAREAAGEDSTHGPAAGAGVDALAAGLSLSQQSSTHTEHDYSSFNLSEDCNSWFLLARQAVVDVMFLDSNQLECQAKLHNSTRTTTVSIGHSIGFAQQLTGVLTTHCDVIQQHKLHCYLQSVHRWLPQITVFCDVKHSPIASAVNSTSSTTSTAPTDNSSGGANLTGLSEEERRRRGSSSGSVHGNTKPPPARTAENLSSVNDRNVLKRHTVLIKQVMALLQRNAVMLFSDCAKEIKPVVEICEITSGDTAAIVLSQVSKFCNKLSHGMESIAAVVNHRCSYDVASNTLQYTGRTAEHAADVGLQDVDCIYTEPSTGATPALTPTRSPNLTPSASAAAFAASASPVGGAGGAVAGSGAGLTQISTEIDVAGMVQTPLRLLLTALLCNMLTSVMPQLNEQLRKLDLPTAEGNREFQVQCMARLELCSQLMLKSFIEVNARYAAGMYASVQQAVYAANYSQLASSNNSSTAAAPAVKVQGVPIADRLLYLVRMLDKIALMGCLVFSELPAHNKARGVGAEGMLQRRASGRQAHSAIEADMDRLFARKVVVYGAVSLGDSTEVVLNTVLKASFKAALEAVRTMTLPYQAYIHIQANALLLKQVAGNLLRDSSECDNLADQILNTAFGRYVGANDISNATDTNETALISRAVGDAFALLSQTTVLVL